MLIIADPKPKNPNGRPPKYKKKYCQELIDHMASGYSCESFAGKLSISKQTLYNWMKKYKEFMDAKSIATEKCRLFWEKIGIGGTAGKLKNYSAPSWIYNMKCRFRDEWVDKDEYEKDVTITLAYEDKSKRSDT